MLKITKRRQKSYPATEGERPGTDLFRTSNFSMHFGRILAPFWVIVRHLGPFWLHFGPVWLHLGLFWLHFGPFWLYLVPKAAHRHIFIEFQRFGGFGDIFGLFV